jgi:hypothetical protein
MHVGHYMLLALHEVRYNANSSSPNDLLFCYFNRLLSSLTIGSYDSILKEAGFSAPKDFFLIETFLLLHCFVLLFYSLIGHDCSMILTFRIIITLSIIIIILSLDDAIATKPIHIPITKRHGIAAPSHTLSKRDKTIPLYNDLGQVYLAKVSVGVPAQNFTLIIDTQR